MPHLSDIVPVNPLHTLPPRINHFVPHTIIRGRSSQFLQRPLSLLRNASEMSIHFGIIRQTQLIESSKRLRQIVATRLQRLRQNPPVFHGERRSRPESPGQSMRRITDEHDLTAPVGQIREFRAFERREFSPTSCWNSAQSRSHAGDDILALPSASISPSVDRRRKTHTKVGLDHFVRNRHSPTMLVSPVNRRILIRPRRNLPHSIPDQRKVNVGSGRMPPRRRRKPLIQILDGVPGNQRPPDRRSGESELVIRPRCIPNHGSNPICAYDQVDGTGRSVRETEPHAPDTEIL